MAKFDFEKSDRLAIRIRHNNRVYLVVKIGMDTQDKKAAIVQKMALVGASHQALQMALIDAGKKIEAITLAKDQEIADLRSQLAAAVAAPPLLPEEAEKYEIEAIAASAEIDRLIKENADSEAIKDAQMIEQMLDNILGNRTPLVAIEPAIELEKIE